MTTSETFYFKMANAIVVFFNVNVMKINVTTLRHARKRIYHACLRWIDKSVPCVTMASLGKPRDDQSDTQDRFVYPSLTHVRFLYSFITVKYELKTFLLGLTSQPCTT